MASNGKHSHLTNGCQGTMNGIPPIGHCFDIFKPDCSSCCWCHVRQSSAKASRRNGHAARRPDSEPATMPPGQDPDDEGFKP